MSETLYETAKRLRVNDVVRVRSLMRAGWRVFSVRVVEWGTRADSPMIAITYAPCDQPDSVQCGFGAAFFDVVPSTWGWQSMEIIGREAPRVPPERPNLYRNPSYDLINM